MKRFILALLLIAISACPASADYNTPRSTPASSITGTLPISNGGTGANSQTNVLTTLDQSTMQLLPHWRAALGRVQAGTGNAKVYFIGDSTWIGYNNGAANGMLTSPAGQLVNFLNKGVNAHYNSHIGTNVSTDGRFSAGSWSQGQFVIGGNNSLYASSSAAGTLSFTPTTNINSCSLYYYSAGTAATFSYNFDGGTATNVVVGTTVGIFTATASTTLGPHTININWVAGTPGFIGFDCQDNTRNWIDVVNGGAGASTSGYWAAAGNGVTTGLNTETYLGQDLTVLNLGINDWSTSVPVATYTANMQAIITRALTVGDVLLVTPVPSNPGSNGAPSLAVQQTYVNAEIALAAANNIPVVNTFGRWVSFAVSNPLNYYNADGIHPLAAGITDQARMLANILMDGSTGVNGVPTYTNEYVLGNIGVGTTTPLYPLDVMGITRSTAVLSGGTKFTTTGCGSAPVGGATAGTYTSGTTGACSTVITMNGATGVSAVNGWACSASDRTTASNIITQTASTTTTATLAGPTNSGDVISFYCMGY